MTPPTPQDLTRRMKPEHLRAIRLDMGANVMSMARMLSDYTRGKISQDRYRSWENPRNRGDHPYVAERIAEAAETIHRAFHDFITTLVSLYDGQDPLVMVHRNKYFTEEHLTLPPNVSVESYNQAVARAWSIIRSQGHDPEIVTYVPQPPDKSTSASTPPEAVHNGPVSNVGAEGTPTRLEQ